MIVDLVLSPFDATATDLVEAARAADDGGFGGVWTFDHLTGSMLGRRWSRHPFTALGAMAAATSRVRLGPLVANMMNRHPVELTQAMATLQPLSGGRAVLGLGSGASPGSRFAAEHEAIGTGLLKGPDRRARMAETIRLVDALWRGEGTFRGTWFSVDGLGEVVGGERRPPLIVGANGPTMVDLALDLADGVNLNLGCDATALLARIAKARPARFETSLLVEPDEHGRLDPAPYRDQRNLDRLVVLVRDPSDLTALRRLSDDLIA